MFPLSSFQFIFCKSIHPLYYPHLITCIVLILMGLQLFQFLCKSALFKETVRKQSLLGQVNNYILKLILQIFGKICISMWGQFLMIYFKLNFIFLVVNFDKLKVFVVCILIILQQNVSSLLKWARHHFKYFSTYQRCLIRDTKISQLGVFNL